MAFTKQIKLAIQVQCFTESNNPKAHAERHEPHYALGVPAQHCVDNKLEGEWGHLSASLGKLPL